MRKNIYALGAKKRKDHLDASGVGGEDDAPALPGAGGYPGGQRKEKKRMGEGCGLAAGIALMWLMVITALIMK